MINKTKDIIKYSLLFIVALILIFAVGTWSEKSQGLTISSHTIYCYEVCKEMVKNPYSPYFDNENYEYFEHCVRDCGGYE